ncbi:deSI-like protein At4g17486 isoform X1 [Cucurbita pepo subsp. pepo]|uniref:deSI-like protein At4g17486 isoform X1 n=1 Tax=Cucurbita pepo subsp. pepo TaxID=3664 RepID=UPI000C9D6C5A|nr:deSI-like protein At4g17486 isoform X1 [Cucurbita pepo subsp. pepo]
MMLLFKKPIEERTGGSVPVYLNVYDLTAINGYAYWFGLGVFHSGVQVHGVEYAFGAHERSTTGIFEGVPKQCDGFRFRKTVLVGKTDMKPTEVRALMDELAQSYKGNAYNLITKNCNHFCNDACVKLTGNSIPNWVNRLARIGFLCNCVLPVTLNSTRIRHHNRIEDKVVTMETKKELTNESTKTPSSDSTSSPSSAVCRGRTRTRRAPPPCSPLPSHSLSSSS